MKEGMKILIAYDGSEHSMHALNQGASLANITDSVIIILSVIPRIIMPLLPAEGMGASPTSMEHTSNEFQQQMKSFYAESLEKARREISEEYPELEVETQLREGKPSSTILEMTDTGDIDLIVIGSRGLGGVTEWLLGSTSRKVVGSSKIPVLVIK